MFLSGTRTEVISVSITSEEGRSQRSLCRDRPVCSSPTSPSMHLLTCHAHLTLPTPKSLPSWILSCAPPPRCRPTQHWLVAETVIKHGQAKRGKQRQKPKKRNKRLSTCRKRLALSCSTLLGQGRGSGWMVDGMACAEVGWLGTGSAHAGVAMLTRGDIWHCWAQNPLILQPPASRTGWLNHGTFQPSSRIRQGEALLCKGANVRCMLRAECSK